MEINLDEIIHRLAKLHPRRLELTNILSDFRELKSATFPAGACPVSP